jgi:AraC-like DNA-binding protein
LCFLYEDSLQTTHKKEVFSTRSGLAGFQSFRSDLGGKGNISGVSARLTPWGLSAFRKGIAMDCIDKRVDCRDIFPKYTIEEIEDNLSDMATAKERIRYIEETLLSLLNTANNDLLIQKACMDLTASNGNYRVRLLAKDLGLSERTFERRFISHIGVSPKRYSRVVRLRYSIFQRKTTPSWAEVAYAAGYYDQSHMIRDFQVFYGFSPESLYPQIEASSTIQFSGLLNLSQAKLHNPQYFKT